VFCKSAVVQFTGFTVYQLVFPENSIFHSY